MGIIMFVALGMTTVIWSIIFHEIGHFIYLKIHGFKPKITFYYDNRKDCGLYTSFNQGMFSLSKGKKFLMYLSGILFGMTPIMIAGTINMYYYFLIFIYILGIKTDLKRMVSIIKNGKEI